MEYPTGEGLNVPERDTIKRRTTLPVVMWVITTFNGGRMIRLLVILILSSILVIFLVSARAGEKTKDVEVRITLPDGSVHSDKAIIPSGSWTITEGVRG